MVLQGYLSGVSIVDHGITSTIDGTNNEHIDTILHFSASVRNGWTEGWENRQKEMTLSEKNPHEEPTKNPDTKRLVDVCKTAYTVHLYKYATTVGGGFGVQSTKKKLRLNQILKWEPFRPESFDTCMDALAIIPELLKVYHDALVTIDGTKSEDT